MEFNNDFTATRYPKMYVAIVDNINLISNSQLDNYKNF